MNKTHALYHVDSLLMLEWQDEDNATFRISDAGGELCSGTYEVTRFPDGTESAQLYGKKMPSAIRERSRFQKAQTRMHEFAEKLRDLPKLSPLNDRDVN